MADPSAYLTRLNWLKHLIDEKNRSIDEMSERMRLLSVFFSIQDTIHFFQEEIEKTKHSIRLHIDEGIDYNAWTNPKWIVGYEWMGSDKEIVDDQMDKSWKANSESIISKNYGEDLSGYLPRSIRPEFSEAIGRFTFSQAIQQLSGPYFNCANLQMAIYNAAIRLAETMELLYEALRVDRTLPEYKAMVTSLWVKYNMAGENSEAVNIAEQFKADKRESSEDITQEWLINRRDEALEIFKKSAFVTAKMRDTNNDPNRAVNRLCTVSREHIEFDKDAEAGKFIYKRHMSPACINEYFAFRKRVELIQDDMQLLRSQEADIFPKEMDFSHSVFNENRNARRIYNTLYQLVQDGLLTAKKQWYIVFLVFKEKNWLKHATGSAFAKDVSAVFDHVASGNIWKPNAADFKEVDSYFKNNSYQQWNCAHSDAPQTCADYKHIADTIDATFDRSFLRQSA